MNDKQRVVIVGAGVAGLHAALGARQQSDTADILLLGAEDSLPYDRTSLSKETLEYPAYIEHKPIITKASLDEENITYRSGSVVCRLHPDKHRIELASGEMIDYDVLVMATGATPRQLPSELCNGMPVSYLRELEDAQQLAPNLFPGQRLVVVGAGLIGLEVAAAAVKNGVHVTVLDMESQLLSRVLDPILAGKVAQWHLDAGVKLRLGVTVSSMQAGQVTLSDGGVLKADWVVVGIGVKPQTSLAEEAGLDVDNGILVDAFGATSVPDIYAAGDVACMIHPHFDYPIRFETWRNAQNHGETVGRNAAGGKNIYSEPSQFWSDQYTHRIHGVGLKKSGDLRKVVRQYSDDSCTIFFLDDKSNLNYCISLDRPQDVAVARRFMEREVILEEDDLKDPSVVLKVLLNKANQKV